MKKSISLLLCFSFLLCLSLKLYPQSAEEKLDQAELVKQFIGTWEREIGKDSVITIKCTPLNNGIHVIQENKANGNTFGIYQGVSGLSDNKEMLIGAFIADDGTTIFDFGKFVAKNKYVVERHIGNITHAAALLEWEFPTTESFVVRSKWRGEGMTWPDDWNQGATFRKID